MDCTALMESVRSKTCDGVILSQIEDPIFIARLHQEDIPFVCVDSHVKDDPNIPRVEVDYYSASYDAAKYLCRFGHKEIGFLAPATPLELRGSAFGGYTTALREEGLVCNPAWIASFDFAPQSASKYFQWLSETSHLPTAFLCSGDAFAIEFIRTAQANGIRVPDDLSIISIDDLVVSRYTSPPLTTMTFDKELLGSKAVEVLYSMLCGNAFERVTLIPTTVCQRDSVKDLRKDA